MTQMPRQLGNYLILRKIGQGGFATVFLGRHIHLKSLAAIKVLHAQFDANEQIDQFRFEAKTIAQLAHPNIVRVLDFDVYEDVTFIVMEYAPFGSLRQQCGRTVVELPSIVSYVNQVAGALAYAHQNRVIHRDVKPENMLIGQDFRVLLSDFGIAIAQTSRFSRQSTKAAVGTLAYIAPEQIQGHPRPASDQYSLGVVAYEWLSGKLPFQGTMAEVTAKHLSVPPPPLTPYGVTQEVERVVFRALAKDPSSALAKCGAFAQAFQRAAGVEPRPLDEEQFQALPSEPAGATTLRRTAVLRSQGSRERVSPKTVVLAQQQEAEEENSRPQHFFERRRVVAGLGVLADECCGDVCRLAYSIQFPLSFASDPATDCDPAANCHSFTTADHRTLQPSTSVSPVQTAKKLYVSPVLDRPVMSAAWSPDGNGSHQAE